MDSRMQQRLVIFVVMLVKFSTAVDKPGVCPSSGALGACVVACEDDSDCKGFQKCCSIGCGQLCQEPVCPAGVPKVSCPSSLCIYSQCPNVPDAECLIDSCGQCKVEYFNKTTWEKVTCSNAGEHLCVRMRELAMKKKLLGQYRPRCTKKGKFEAVQQSGSVLFCVDEETGIPDFKTSKQIGTGSPDCSKKDCQDAREKALKLPRIGRFVPSCKEDGSYQKKQCHPSTGYCWCVDEKGREWFGTRKRGSLDCSKSMCPAGVKKVEGCDPMICIAATCHGHKQSEVSCRINPCGQCKAEFLDKYNRLATCQTCANRRAKILADRHLIGQYVPQCDKDGNYHEVQCWSSVGQCWCVKRETGEKIDGTMTRGTPRCKGTLPTTLLATVPPPKRQPVCPNGAPTMLCLRPFCQWSSGCAANPNATCQVNPCKMCAVEYFDDNNNLVDCKGELSECQLKRADALSSKNIGLQPVGRFIPQCDKDGNYSRIQCWASTGYCWCVDPLTGVEQELTRVRGKPNCATKTHEKLFVNNTEIKPGRCPTVKPTDSCVEECANDTDCHGRAKCCEIGCGKTCREPVDEQLACPNGYPFLLCLHHCQLASCPARPDAECTVDPCRMCKVEFKDSQGNVVNCSEKLTPCQLQRASSPLLPGSFRPRCDSDGRYETVQCYGSIGYCWCVDEDGREINNTRQRGMPNCTAVAKQQKVLSKCQLMRLKAIQSGLLGARVPQCEDDGRFKEIQSWEGYLWCVDANGIEILGTRVAPRQGSPDCSKACRPVMCNLYCQYGYVKDSRGCKICRCAQVPYKPGVCPSTGPTSNSCSDDFDCAGTMKCCDKTCRLPIVKLGYCPNVNTTDGGYCKSDCAQDNDCRGQSKCCASGCSRVCQSPTREVCPNGAPLVMCVRNMCDARVSCPAYPQATCRMNYCGQCSVEFVLPNGTIVDCGNGEDQMSSYGQDCAGNNQTMYFCSQSLCVGETCAKHPTAVCKVPVMSCNCSVAFYDKNGNEIDCLTDCQRKRKEVESRPLLIGAFKPQCEANGSYSRKQCSGSTGQCWCVSEDGTEWPGTRVRGEPDCSEKRRPQISGIQIQLSFDANYDTIKDHVEEFKNAFVEQMENQFGVDPQQISEIQVTRGSIVVKFILVKDDNGKDVRNVSNYIRNSVLSEEFVIAFAGEEMVARPDSYSYSLKMPGESSKSGGSSTLAIVLGVVIGLVVVVVLVGVILYVYKRQTGRDYKDMSVNAQDSEHPLKKQ